MWMIQGTRGDWKRQKRQLEKNAKMAIGKDRKCNWKRAKRRLGKGDWKRQKRAIESEPAFHNNLKLLLMPGTIKLRGHRHITRVNKLCISVPSWINNDYAVNWALCIHWVAPKSLIHTYIIILESLNLVKFEEQTRVGYVELRYSSTAPCKIIMGFC